MRDHLNGCLERKKLTPFPERDLQSTCTISEEPLLTTVPVKVYCSCRMPRECIEQLFVYQHAFVLMT